MAGWREAGSGRRRRRRSFVAAATVAASCLAPACHCCCLSHFSRWTAVVAAGERRAERLIRAAVRAAAARAWLLGWLWVQRQRRRPQGRPAGRHEQRRRRQKKSPKKCSTAAAVRVLKRDNELMAPPFLRRHVSKMAPCLGLLFLRPIHGAVFESWQRSRVCFAAPRPAQVKSGTASATPSCSGDLHELLVRHRRHIRPRSCSRRSAAALAPAASWRSLAVTLAVTLTANPANALAGQPLPPPPS